MRSDVVPLCFAVEVVEVTDVFKPHACIECFFIFGTLFKLIAILGIRLNAFNS